MGKLASDANNIRYNGTGRVYVRRTGEGMIDLGELESVKLSIKVSTDKMTSNRTAAKGTVLEVETEREGTLSVELREISEENALLAFLGKSFVRSTQIAGYRDLTVLDRAEDQYVSLGKRDVFVTRIGHGAVSSGTFSEGNTLTGGTSLATGKIVFVGTDYLELVNVSGDFANGETLTESTTAKTATVNSVATRADVCVVDAATPTERYVQGVDYDLDAQAGLLRIRSALTGGGIDADPYVACDYPGLSLASAFMFAGAVPEVAFKFVSDAGDTGPRVEIDVHRVKLILSGDTPLLGKGAALLSLSGTILADTSRPADEQYWQLTTIGQAA